MGLKCAFGVALAGTCIFGAALPAFAAEFRIEGGLWNYRVSGFQDDHGTITDLESFAPGTRRDGFLQIEYQHRPSWWPDLAASYTQVSGSGSQTNSGTTIGGITLPGTGSTSSASGDFRDIDASARYAIHLGPILISPGLSVKSLRGHVTTSDSSGNQVDRSYDNTFPMLHTQITWPVGDFLRLAAQGDWIRGGDNEAYQYGASAELRLLGPLGLYGGWQQRRYKVSASNSFLDARLRGWRYGLIIVF